MMFSSKDQVTLDDQRMILSQHMTQFEAIGIGSVKRVFTLGIVSVWLFHSKKKKMQQENSR